MGVAHVFFLREDGMKFAAGNDRIRAEQETGKAIFQLALEPQYELPPEGTSPGRVCDTPLGSHFNCINWVDEVHSTDTRLYAWLGNCLRPISKLTDAGLQEAMKCLEDEIRKRRK